MEIKRYNIPKLPRNRYATAATSIVSSGGGDSTSYVYNTTVDIYDGLDSSSTKKALSANQGKILNEKTTALQEQITAANDKFLSKKEEDTAEKIIHFLEGIDAQGMSSLEDITLLGNLLSSNFVEDSTGFGIYQDEDGKYHFDIDFLNVRGKFTTEVLEVKESKHIGGKLYSTSAGIIISKVETGDNYYRCYFNTVDTEGRTIYNQFAVNDQAFMQTFNLEQQTEGKIGNRRFWRLVVDVGTDYIDLSKTDCESKSDIPIVGDSVVQLGNRTDKNRQGALIIEPLSMKVYKGINSYLLPKPFIDLNPDESVIEAKLINKATGEDINDTINTINSKVNQIKVQNDKCFTIWIDAYTPTLDNAPAVEWTTDEIKDEHLQDIFYNSNKTSGGRAYRFEKDGSVYVWNEITDKDTIAALEQAQDASNVANSKRRVFVEQPDNSSEYEVGDLWVNANWNDGVTIYKNDQLVCIVAKAKGSAFSIAHWKPTSTATTAYLENLGNQIVSAVTDSNEGIDAAKKLAEQGITDAANALAQAQQEIAIAKGEAQTGINDAKTLAQKGINDAAGALTKAQQGITDAANAMNKANSAYNLANTANSTATSNTTVISQTKDSITALANKITFDRDNNITNISTAGLVTTADFADLFAQRTTADGLVKRADISTFITEDDAKNVVSNAVISADKIDFLGKTTINGNFVVDTSGNVTMNNATVNGTINATAGLIGGLKIVGNSLTNEGFNNDAYIIMRNDTNNVFCGIGGNVLPASTGTRAVARFENSYNGGSTNDPYQTSFGANYAAIVSAKNARYNIGLAMNGGFIQGMALRTDVITSSQTISRNTNVVVTLSNTAQIHITLPTMYAYDDGHFIVICNQGSYGGEVRAGTNIENGVTRNSYISSEEDGNKILANNTKGIHRMTFVYCHYITTTIGDYTYSGCWMRIA